MDKKIYQKPTMKVVLLKQCARLLVGSEKEFDGLINPMEEPEEI